MWSISGYAIKKILKINPENRSNNSGTVCVGSRVSVISRMDKRTATENGTTQALVGAVSQTALVVRHTSAQFAAQHNSGDISNTPISAAIGFIIGIPVGS